MAGTRVLCTQYPARVTIEAGIERELKLRQRIYKFAELSDKERKRRSAFLIAEK